MRYTKGPWVVDDGMVTMDDQANILVENVGSDRQWIAIGINDDEGFAEVVALAHPNNARLIAAAPKMYEALKQAVIDVEELCDRLESLGCDTGDWEINLADFRETLAEVGDQ